MKNNYKEIQDINFRKEVIQSSRPVLVEFVAEWCGLCHIMDPLIKNIAPDYVGKIKIFRMNADESKSAVRTYGVRLLPTLLFFKGGEVVDHVVGALSRSELVNRLESLMSV